MEGGVTRETRAKAHPPPPRQPPEPAPHATNELSVSDDGSLSRPQINERQGGGLRRGVTSLSGARGPHLVAGHYNNRDKIPATPSMSLRAPSRPPDQPTTHSLAEPQIGSTKHRPRGYEAAALNRRSVLDLRAEREVGHGGGAAGSQRARSGGSRGTPPSARVVCSVGANGAVGGHGVQRRNWPLVLGMCARRRRCVHVCVRACGLSAPPVADPSR